MKIKCDIAVSSDRVNKLIADAISSKTAVRPELVTETDVSKPSAYKRLQNQDEKQAFRDKLISALVEKWGTKDAERLQKQFLVMADQVSSQGAIIFGDLIHKESFEKLVAAYDDILLKHGNKSWIHSYVNLANHPEYLTNQTFNDAFLHPLLIALISYYIGGPVRIVDARAKDAEPLSIKAQDNMLHIDNTPFNDEFKIITTWERLKASGPKGQYFVFIPGTHKAVRQCHVNKEGQAWSSENGSIFIRPNEVRKVFDMQRQLLKTKKPMVVEAKHDTKPLTTVFAAGSLVHHRYRTQEGLARSCMILALHRAKDNPGEFISHQSRPAVNGCKLNKLLFGSHGNNTDEAFIRVITSYSEKIANKVCEISETHSNTEVLQHNARELTSEQLLQWEKQVTASPTVETKKIKELQFPLGQSLDIEKFTRFLSHRMMMFDKHGPLDLILYEDAHEEIRKWARNRIREMKQSELALRIEKWSKYIKDPATSDLLTTNQLAEHTKLLASNIHEISDSDKKSVKLPDTETIPITDAFKSLLQLTNDLGEAILRCEDRQSFLSTCLFIFLATDQLIMIHPNPSSAIIETGARLLKNYIATSILIEKQITNELLLKNISKINLTLPINNQFTGYSSFFKKAESAYIINNRHTNAATQHEYDKRFGLMKIGG